MARNAAGTASSPALIGGDAAEARASYDAAKALQRSLREECDAVPCPHCGGYQPNMVDLVRNRHLAYLRILATGVLLLASPIYVVIYARAGLTAGMFALLVAVSVSVIMFALRWHLAGRYDPNSSTDVEARKATGRRRVADAWAHYGTGCHRNEFGPVGLGRDGQDGIVFL
jgi:hypothetical protein